MGEEDGGDDPAGDSSQSAARHRSCEYCGAEIDTSEWYPVLQRRGSDGEPEFYPFCSEDCQESWRDE
ncbi:hypothetical protein ACFQMA_02705 [Halosimplex aquaticum]|uniref:Small CPxCG-related zinc finger protein n=1 Tax=Halosimplex aquaticum TaxID=3026162 RepID=A0ABD5XZD1_9EURY|nr:hypothetical protein [Halosimplex aquaticum]